MELKVLVCLSYHPNILKSSWPQKDLRLWHKSQTTISSKCFLIFSGINIWIIKKNNQDWFNFKNIFLKRFYSRLIIQSLLDITRAITRSSVNYREFSGTKKGVHKFNELGEKLDLLSGSSFWAKEWVESTVHQKTNDNQLTVFTFYPLNFHLYRHFLLVSSLFSKTNYESNWNRRKFKRNVKNVRLALLELTEG